MNNDVCVVFFQEYNPFKIQITPYKNKNYMFFYVNPTKKTNHTSKSNTPLITLITLGDI
jgi:hypothetical protein